MTRRRQYSVIEMELAMMLKPALLVIKKKGDPEQLAKDWEDYVKVFKEFLEATGVTGVHDDPEVRGTPCAACVKAKNMLRLMGGMRSELCLIMLEWWRILITGRSLWKRFLKELRNKRIKQLLDSN